MTSLESATLFACDMLGKRFDKQVALANVQLEIPSGRIVGLLGRNGAGKTTLLNLASGLLLPTTGWCRTLGKDTAVLDTPELARLGVVQQEASFLEWLTVAQHLSFTASCYPTWDASLEARLLEALELDSTRKIAQLSTGDRQKMAILLGVCHRPALLLLDEPMSALDPIVRARMLDVLLERLRDDGCTVLISSHILNDVEKIVDWVICLDKGKVTADLAFDELQESYAEWTVTALNGTQLPASFPEPQVLSCESNGRLARLVVHAPENDAAAQFAATHNVEVRTRPLNLSEMFPYLTQGGRKSK